MTDTPTPGERLDARLAALHEAFEELRAAVEARADQVGAQKRIRDLVATVSARIDDVQAEWGHDETDSDAEA